MAGEALKLKKIVADANARLAEIEAAERDKDHADKIGRCFKYHNSNGDGERWWLYVQVLESKDGYLRGIKFETDNRGEIRIEPTASLISLSHLFGQHYGLGGYTEITEEEFNENWQALLVQLRALKAVAS